MVPGRKGGVWAPCIASDEVDGVAPMDACSNVGLPTQMMIYSNIQVVLRQNKLLVRSLQLMLVIGSRITK